MAVFCSSAFAKPSRNKMSSVLFCIVLFVQVSLLVADTTCEHYKLLVVKPTTVYKHCDIKIHVNEAKSPPTIALPAIKNITSTNLTTIVMLSPKGQNSVHWLRTNISTEMLVIGTSSRDNDVLPYRGPSPPEDTGEFHYQLYLLSQPHGNVSIHPYIDQYRKHFKMAEFQSANDMKVLGFFQYRTEFAFSSSGRLSFRVFSGIVFVVLVLFFGA